MQLTGLRPLCRSMREQGLGRVKFRYRLNGLDFECLFFADTQPFELAMGCLGRNFAILKRCTEAPIRVIASSLENTSRSSIGISPHTRLPIKRQRLMTWRATTRALRKRTSVGFADGSTTTSKAIACRQPIWPRRVACSGSMPTILRSGAIKARAGRPIMARPLRLWPPTKRPLSLAQEVRRFRNLGREAAQTSGQFTPDGFSRPGHPHIASAS